MTQTPTDRVLVLAGGLSHERDVSLRSGRRVAEALRTAGLSVEEADVDAGLLTRLRDDPPTCVVPLVHGEAGEDGSVRELLELLDVPYVGARPGACRMAFDKPVAQEVVAGAGIAVPRSVALPHEMFRELGAPAVIDLITETIGLPLVVKPARGGSALGVSVVHDLAELPGAMVGCFAYGPVALLQHLVTGTEVAVGVVDVGDGPTALPAVGIAPRSGVYDYRARYTAGETEFQVPAALSETVATACAETAVTAHRALGLRHLSRSDLIVDDDGTVWFLEVNVAPGMTETSSVPLAVEASDWDLPGLCEALVRTASAGR